MSADRSEFETWERERKAHLRGFAAQFADAWKDVLKEKGYRIVKLRNRGWGKLEDGHHSDLFSIVDEL